MGSLKNFRQLALWLGAIVLAVYMGSLNGSFHFDDSHSVEANMAIRSPLNIPSFWTDPRTSSFIPENRVYRPLVYTFYSFCWALGGGKTFPFHVMKIFMHWMVVLALFLIWRRLWSEPGWFPVKSLKIRFPFFSGPLTLTPTWASFLLAILFAIHPAGSECVDYISATTSLQCAMFYVWAYYSYLVFRDSGDVRKLVLSLFLYFLSVASKEEGITLPAMVAITEFFLLKGDLPGRILASAKRAIPYVVLGAGLGVWIVLMRPESGNESRGYFSSWEYFMTQWRAYLYYMRIWFWPWDFNADNASMEFTRSLGEPLAIQALLGNLFVLAVTWFNRKRFPALAFGIVWFFVTISPASSVVVLAEAINEHRMYLAYIGFVGGTFTILLAMADALFAAETRATRLGWIYLLIVVGFVIGTQERNRVWANDENLWLDTVEKNPTSGRALNNLALVYLGRGEYQRAVGYFEKCEQYWTTYLYCPLNLGISYRALGAAAEKENKKEEALRLNERAEKSLARAYQLNSRNVHVNFHLGTFQEEVKHDYAKAAEHYKTAVELTGWRYPSADLKLGQCLSKLKRFAEAKEAFDRAVSVEPDNEAILFERGRIELDNQNTEAASMTYKKLLERNPGHVQGWYNYGVSFVERKLYTEARAAFEKTVALDPRSEQGWFNLAFVQEKTGDGVAAMASFKRLLEINPTKSEYQVRLKELQSRFGQGRS